MSQGVPRWERGGGEAAEVTEAEVLLPPPALTSMCARRGVHVGT
jgi:hypothetical protein